MGAVSTPAYVTVAVLTWVAAIASVVTAVLLEPEDFRPGLVAACDDIVRTLLKTKDLVELERSTYLIERLHCRVRTRLEPAP